MTVISRLQLDHPALGAAGGAGLHASITAIYQKLGDNMSTRILTAIGLANGATATVEHDFKDAFVDMRYDLYLYNTGTTALTRITASTSPSLSQFTIIANVTNPTTHIDITNNSGASRDLALILIVDPVYLSEGDVKDVDITGIQDGQSLVYNAGTGKMVAGASGDSSYKVQGVTTPNASLKGGYIALSDGKELATYSGSGSVAASYGVDLTLNLTTILGSSPANATAYYLVIDLTTLGTEQTVTDTGRKLYQITVSNFKLLTTSPTGNLMSRYVPIAEILSATTGTAWSGSGSAFQTYSTKKHFSGPDFDQSTAAQDGQALVYDIATGKYKPGASGDASFKLQTITSNVAEIKAGSIFLDDGKELYLAADASVNLKTAVNSQGVTAPANTTAYYGYLDLAFLPAQTLVGGSDRKVYAVASGTSGMYVVLATSPESTDLNRYVPLYSLKTDGSGNYTSFQNLALRRHQLQAVNISPLVYEDADHSIGSVGAVGSLANFGALSTADFPTPANAHVYALNSVSTDGNTGTPLDLTQNGTPQFVRTGFFGRENLPRFDGSTIYLSSASSVFNIGNVAFSYGGWFYIDSLAAAQTLMGNFSGTTGWMLYVTATGLVKAYYGPSNLNFDIGTIQVGTWNHFAVTYATSGTLFTAYMNGQKASTLSATNVSPSANFKIGAYGTNSEPLRGVAQECFFALDTLTDAQVNSLYSKRFKGQQLAGGHVLATDSFPLASLSGKATFYNLSANANDGSANAKNLTNNGSTPFTGLGLFGAADCAKLNGSSQYFNISDAFFAEALSKVPVAFFTWVAMDDYTPGATNRLFAYSSGPTVYFDGTNIALDGAATLLVPIATLSGLIDGQWAHIGVTFYNGVNTLWIDGVPVGSNNADYGTSSSNFYLGASSTPSQYLKGRLSNACFIKNVILTAQDIQKLMASRIDLPSTVAVPKLDQKWDATFISEDGQIGSELPDSWLVDKDDTKIWAYFGGASASRVNLRLHDGGLGGTTVPVRKFDRTFTSTPATTLAHGLPSMPTFFTILHNQLADGKYVDVTADFPVKVDGVNIYVDLSSLTIDATHDLRIVASIGTPATADSSTVVAGLSSANSNPNSQNLVLAPVASQVNLAYIAAPSTTVVNRGTMVDLSKDLMPRMGIERFQTQQIMEVFGEIGPSGETIFKPVNDKFDQVRFGGAWTNQNNSTGQRADSGSATDFVEISFYGTGLNLLDANWTGGSYTDHTTLVDGVAGSNISNSFTGSSILNGRNYSPNRTRGVVAGLSLGLHTVKITAGATGLSFLGFEVLNESSNIKTSAGTALINGVKRTLAALDSAAYNSGFTNTYGTAGSRGGRVVQYMRADGTIGKDIQYVNTASATIASASHANEELIRTYSPREFGAARADDFSTNTANGSARAFTLDDGVTSLTANITQLGFSIGGSLDTLRLGGVTNVATFTFVGTGLDLDVDLDGGSDTSSVSIDGASTVNFTYTGKGTQKIVSGLPYGTHTAKFTYVSGGGNLAILKFLVYGPKKPAIPAGALELADYSIMATYVAASLTGSGVAGVTQKSTGILSKAATREVVYAGTWTTGLDVINSSNGWLASSSTASSYIEYTFFGTGAELKTTLQSGQAIGWTVTIDGVAVNTAGGTATLIPGSITGLSISAAGVLSGTAGGSNYNGAIVAVTGLALGKHTIRVTYNSGMILYVEGFEVITPIHVHKNSGPYVLQNTLSVGSHGIADKRYLGSQIAVPPASVYAYGLATHSITSTTYVPLNDMLATIKTKGGMLEIVCTAGFRNQSAGATVELRTYLDGVNVGSQGRVHSSATSQQLYTVSRVTIPVSPGEHTVQAFWVVSASTGDSLYPDLGRAMTVRELL